MYIGTDILEMSELDGPLLDIVLKPGQILYVPAGFPHTTDTMFINDDQIPVSPSDNDPSVHLTIGIDTLIWGITYANLRKLCLNRAGFADKIVDTKLQEERYWELNTALPFGFMTDHIIPEDAKGTSTSHSIVFIS